MQIPQSDLIQRALARLAELPGQHELQNDLVTPLALAPMAARIALASTERSPRRVRPLALRVMCAPWLAKKDADRPLNL
jgi:hypothetical protein